MLRDIPAVSTYYGLRNYGEDAQIGLEDTPEAYIAALVDVFREVKRVLRDDGTCWIVIGDSYNSASQNNHGKGGALEHAHLAPTDGWAGHRPLIAGLKNKDLIGIPYMLAFALRADGWYWRSAITWCKNNAMPESVTDRPTQATEMVLLFAKGERYFFDNIAIAEPSVKTDMRETTFKRSGTKQNGLHIPGHTTVSHREDRPDTLPSPTRNKRNWWVVNSQPYGGAHFATYPEKLIEPMILAGSSAHGACSMCGSPYARDKQRDLEYNEGYGIPLQTLPADAPTGGIRYGSPEEGRSPVHVPRVRHSQAQGELDLEPREGSGASEDIPGDTPGRAGRAQATISGNGSWQGSYASEQQSLPENRAGRGDHCSGGAQAGENGAVADAWTDSLQSSQSSSDERAGDVHQDRLDGTTGEAETALFLLSPSIHQETTTNNRSRHSPEQGRASQSREYRSGLQAVQQSQVGPDHDDLGLTPHHNTTGWHPTCNCPDAAVRPCLILDPFFGSGTTGRVSLRLGRDCIGVELNPAYVEQAERRNDGVQTMMEILP